LTNLRSHRRFVKTVYDRLPLCSQITRCLLPVVPVCAGAIFRYQRSFPQLPCLSKQADRTAFRCLKARMVLRIRSVGKLVSSDAQNTVYALGFPAYMVCRLPLPNRKTPQLFTFTRLRLTRDFQNLQDK